MRNISKKLLTVGTALVMGVSVFAFAGCSTEPLSGDTSGEVSSNGGFVVEKGNYIYFINGVDDYTSSNKFGEVVKASLMRISKTDLNQGNFGASETVVPSLIVAEDYTSGIYIYGDRVYYATPTTAKNTSGEVENTYLDFKSTKLDGTDTSSYYFRASDNTAPYRYTEIDGVVYCLHIEDSTELYSCNTATKEDTLLVSGMTSYVMDQTNKTDGGVYYTMSVTVGEDKANSYAESYNQVYYVTADVTEAPYEYTYDEDYLKDYQDENGKDAMPYTNLGTIVLDGRGNNNAVTQYNHNTETESYTPNGYTYTLIQYANDGLYYTRSYVDTTDSVGDGGWMFYLPQSNTLASGWNSVSGNPDTTKPQAGDLNDVIAYDSSTATSSAIFCYENGQHSYIYTSGISIFTAYITEESDGIRTESVRIASSASGATLLFVDTTSDSAYHYIYYSMANANGNGIYRTVYNGTAEDYNHINANQDYEPVQILDIDYNSSWYTPELLGTKLFFANAAAIGSSSYNYIYVADLANANGGMMTNSEIEAFNDKYDEIQSEFETVSTSYVLLYNLMQYHYYSAGNTGTLNRYYETYRDLTGANAYEITDYYAAALAEAAKEGYSDTYLYSKYYQDTFAAFVNRTGKYEGKFIDESGAYYGVESYFINMIGEYAEEDGDAIDSVFADSWIVTIPEDEDEGLPVWAIVLIVIGSVIVAAGIACAIAIPLALRAKRKKQAAAAAEEKPRLHIDTTDDTSIDVYAVDADETMLAEKTEIPESDEDEKE